MENLSPHFTGPATSGNHCRRSHCLIIIILLLAVNIESFSKMKTLNNTAENHSYYRSGKKQCIKCPAGTYVKKDCISTNTQGVCAQCKPGSTYSEFLTGLQQCLACTKCAADQEELSPCNITKNTMCSCKSGTYCPGGHPCAKCLPCTANCPEGQVLKQPCNSTEDIQCVPERDVGWYVKSTFFIITFAVTLLILILAAILIYSYKMKRKGQKCEDKMCEVVDCPDRKLHSKLKQSRIEDHPGKTML
ncbi:tumor necrosis factor receptor superfamily member 23-like [Hyperolius riggenbachi]|uniref:tumor necrosis factor receptor superfamily member 23-like n=1 Tax=Hyperolius riggenbachi TaxID=752182 RepID=UPI0035A2AD6A